MNTIVFDSPHPHPVIGMFARISLFHQVFTYMTAISSFYYNTPFINISFLFSQPVYGLYPLPLYHPPLSPSLFPRPIINQPAFTLSPFTTPPFPPAFFPVQLLANRPSPRTVSWFLGLFATILVVPYLISHFQTKGV